MAQISPEDESFIGQTYQCDRARSAQPNRAASESESDPINTGLVTEALGGDGLAAAAVSTITGDDTLGLAAGLLVSDHGAELDDDHQRFGGGHSGGAGASGDFHDTSADIDHSDHDIDVSDDGPDLDFDFDFD